MMKVTKVWPHKYVSGKLLGFADVAFSLDGNDEQHMIWKGFKLFQSNDGGIQIGFPSRKDDKEKLDEKGKIIYHPVIIVTKEENGGPGNDFIEMVRQEIETAYYALDTQEVKSKETTVSNGPTGIEDEDLPF